MAIRIFAGFLTLLTCALNWPAVASAQTADDWRETVVATCQQPDAAWRTIPWQTDLLAGQRLALQQEKPLFIWAMDGHPLGCT
jgi:hypothetical protein